MKNVKSIRGCKEWGVREGLCITPDANSLINLHVFPYDFTRVVANILYYFYKKKIQRAHDDIM